MRIFAIVKRVVLLLLLLALLGGIRYAWQAFPIISGYGAKNMASAVFLQHRKPADVIKEDLGDFPKSLGSYEVDENAGTVTGSVWGLAKRKVIYRKGLGCTVINDFTEDAIRAQTFNLPAKPVANYDTIAWPYGDKLSDSISANINTAAMQQAIDHAMTATANGEPAYTRALLVLYDGKIVGEKYAPGFDKHTVMLGWSMSKSLTAAMIGVLVKQGKLNTSSPAPVPEWKGTEKEKITLENLLQQTSGLDFNEVYTGPSEVTNMLFKRGDMAAFTANRSLKYAPGTVFNYTSGNANIISRIIRHTVGEKDYAAFPFTALFHKINMYSALLEPDASGTYIGSSYSYATARDFARFGLLYYNNGVWNGEQLLPTDWVKKSTQPSTADKLQHYGYQFWLNGFDEINQTNIHYPDAPRDMFYADGYGGQYVFIIPSKKLVVVRMGLHDIDENAFLKDVIAAVKN